MVWQECDLIRKLKSSFFDIFNIENGLLDQDSIISQMLLAIQENLDADGVTLYKHDLWNGHFSIQSSTFYREELNIKYSRTEMVQMQDSTRFKRVFRNDLPLTGFNQEDLILVLSKDTMNSGLIALRGIDGTKVTDEDLEAIADECALFLKKVQNLTKIVTEEKRYRQLFRVTEKFHSSMDMDAVLGEVISTLQEVYPTFTYYLLLSQDNHNDSGLPIKDLEYDSENIAAMQAYVTGEFQFEDSLHEKRSILYAPLKGKQGVYGVMQIIAPNTRVFPKEEVEFITLLAFTAGSALENAQLYQQSKRLVADLQLINETSHRLNSNLRLSETIQYMCSQIRQSFDAQEVGFILLSDTKRTLKVLSGSTPFFEEKEAKLYVDHLKEKLDQELDSIFIGDFILQQDGEPLPYRAVMAVPMIQAGILKGFTVVLHTEPYHFSFETFKLLQSLIHHSTLAFANSILREELEKMVITDHLTKLHSRNYLDDRVHLSMEEDAEGTFILIDIDNFKVINDTYGHQTGDDVIIQVANLIHRNIRGTDVGARWGGEELAIYLPKIPLDTGVAIAQRLVSAVEDSTTPKVTISCGVSYWTKKGGDSVKNLVRRADEALYTAKETGKNKVVIQESLIKSFEALT